MPNQEIVELRNRIIGILIHSVRERARASQEECAVVLGIPTEQFVLYEEGGASISLPELELLSRYLEVPLRTFREADALGQVPESEKLPDPELFLPLRHRIVGARLRQARMEAGRSEQNLAEILEIEVSRIQDYEQGTVPIPIAELEVLARALAVPIDFFEDQDSDVGIWHQLQDQFKQFSALPAEIRDFVLRPINMSYLEVAMKLASMPAGALRQIAEGILEITY